MSESGAPFDDRRHNRVVCTCFGVTEHELHEAIERHDLESVAGVARCTAAGDACTACHPAIRQFLEERAKSREKCRFVPSGNSLSRPA